jgi:hypothetical protein
MGVASVDVLDTSPPLLADKISTAYSGSEGSAHAGQHPALKKMCVLDCGSMTEIVPNAVPIKIENECFSGTVMMLIRTPEVDDIHEVVPTSETAQRISTYMKPLKRRFEFQFQIKLKKVPTGPLFLGCEVNEPIKVSRWTKGLSGVLLAMIRRINSGFHYSWGADLSKTDPAIIKTGKYERAHLSFPVEASMDRIVITKPGEALPELGYELHETDQSVKRRRKMGAGSVDWNVEDTYTMCLWSAYCDWIRWRTLNVPGVRPFSLSIVGGQQPIYLSVYELSNVSPTEYRKKKPPHNRCDLQIYTRLEFTHREMTVGGLSPRFQEKYTGEISDDSLGETDSELGSAESDVDYGKKLAST